MRALKRTSLVIASALVVAALLPMGSAGAIRPPYPDPNGPLTSISCVSPTFCRAGGSDGAVYAWNGRRWSVETHIGTDIDFISCTSSAFCALSYYGPASSTDGYNTAKEGTAFYRNGTWTQIPVSTVSYGVPREIGRVALSCSSPTVCVAFSRVYDGNQDGVTTLRYDTWNGKRWTEGSYDAAVDSYQGPEFGGLDCLSSTDCRAANGTNSALVWNGKSWHSESITPAGEQFMRGIACPSRTFCVTAGRGNSWLYRGGKWQHYQHLSSADFTDVSCAGTSFCVATTNSGSTHLWNGRRWTIGKHIGSSSPSGGLTVNRVSCPTSDFCQAITSDGGIYLKRGGAAWHGVYHV